MTIAPPDPFSDRYAAALESYNGAADTYSSTSDVELLVTNFLGPAVCSIGMSTDYPERVVVLIEMLESGWWIEFTPGGPFGVIAGTKRLSRYGTSATLLPTLMATETVAECTSDRDGRVFLA